ncbi:MAG: response regulator [Proteobacteria bacterium]|nr:response regulator [Pseudomonadota bacterium]MBU1582320.1 response regulator [Pseudomonadota bacterium]MBU2627980.1 response regulator [Pseudomonadota bacterium]
MEYKKTILIIDDMKQIRDILWFSLKQEGYKPILAENGQRGLACLFDKETHVDLVILDVMMPKMDGFQVLEKIRTSNALVSKIPVIMLTAKAQKDDVIKGLSKGASDYVLKPYKFADLLVKVQNLIG